MILKERFVERLKIRYERHFDLNYIDELIKDSLNVNLHQAWDRQVLEHGFIKRLLFFLILDIMTIFANIAAEVTWTDPQTNTAVIGNFYIGMGFPKQVVLLVVRCLIIYEFMKYLLSYRIYKQDAKLYRLLKLVKFVTGNGTADADRAKREVHPKVLEKLKQETTKMAAILKFAVGTLHGPFFGASAVAFGGLFFASKSNVTTWKIIPTILWSIHWGLVGHGLVVTPIATIVILMIVSNWVRSTMNMMDGESKDVDECTDAQIQISFQSHIRLLMSIVTAIRHYNLAIRLVIGFNIFSCFSVATIVSFAIFFCPIPDIVRLFLFGFAFYFLTILLLTLIFVADLSIQVLKRVKSLTSLSRAVGLKPTIRHKLNYVIEEMRFNTSFDCSMFIPDIDFSFIIKVICEMVSLILLAVRMYVVNPNASN